jgi:hypothetical protein
MPAVSVSNKCAKCMDTNNNHSCSAYCNEYKRVASLFALCNRRGGCRHKDACEQSPQTCGYWADLSYPVEVS